MPPLNLADLERDLTSRLPKELVRALLSCYREIKENFYLGKHEPSELNGGKFCEVVIRILEHEAYTKFTPLGVQIKNMGDKLRQFENATANDSVRFHIPRVVNGIYNVRNKRGVGHVGGDVSPNQADATLVATSCDWILAELVRIHYTIPLAEAQKIVDALVQRRLPIVFEIGGRKRVLNPKLKFNQKVLLVLASEHPAEVRDKTLFEWVEHSNFTSFRQAILEGLHEEKLIEYHDGLCTILPPGLRVVETNYAGWSNA